MCSSISQGSMLHVALYSTCPKGVPSMNGRSARLTPGRSIICLCAECDMMKIHSCVLHRADKGNWRHYPHKPVSVITEQFWRFASYSESNALYFFLFFFYNLQHSVQLVLCWIYTCLFSLKHRHGSFVTRSCAILSSTIIPSAVT